MTQNTNSKLAQSILISELTMPKESAKSPRKRLAYVSNLGSESISVIDLLNGTLVKNVIVGKYPIFSLIYPSDPNKIVVALHNYDRKEYEDLIMLADLSNDKVVKKIPYPGITVPSGMVYDINHKRLYVADESDEGYIHIHDGKTLKLLNSLPAGRATVHVDISSNGSYLAATNRLSADLCVYNLEKKPITAQDTITISLGQPRACHPFDVKFSKSSNICYISDFNANEILIVDIARRTIIERIRVGANPFGMALDKVGSTAYICNWGSNSVSVVDLSKNEVIGEITELKESPSHCVIDEIGNKLVVTCMGRDKNFTGSAVHIIDLTTLKAIATITDDKIQGPVGVSMAA
jgi:YVTN family beta-propeller protein